MTTYIGIDNGVTGSIGIINNEKIQYYPIPTITQQSYTKKKQNITRLDVKEFKNIVHTFGFYDHNILITIERPMINPGRFVQSLSAIRCLEAVLIVIEKYEYSYQYIDSKKWQKSLLPSGLKSNELKKASMDIGIRLFPHLKREIEKQKDADGLLIAEYCRRKYK